MQLYHLLTSQGDLRRIKASQTWLPRYVNQHLYIPFVYFLVGGKCDGRICYIVLCKIQKCLIADLLFLGEQINTKVRVRDLFNLRSMRNCKLSFILPAWFLTLSKSMTCSNHQIQQAFINRQTHLLGRQDQLYPYILHHSITVHASLLCGEPKSSACLQQHFQYILGLVINYPIPTAILQPGCWAV